MMICATQTGGMEITMSFAEAESNYQDVMELNPMNISFMFIICRIIDGGTDLLVGFLIDKPILVGEKADHGFCLVRYPSH